MSSRALRWVVWAFFALGGLILLPTHQGPFLMTGAVGFLVDGLVVVIALSARTDGATLAGALPGLLAATAFAAFQAVPPFGAARRGPLLLAFAAAVWIGADLGLGSAVAAGLRRIAQRRGAVGIAACVVGVAITMALVRGGSRPEPDAYWDSLSPRTLTGRVDWMLRQIKAGRSASAQLDPCPGGSLSSPYACRWIVVPSTAVRTAPATASALSCVSGPSDRHLDLGALRHLGVRRSLRHPRGALRRIREAWTGDGDGSQPCPVASLREDAGSARGVLALLSDGYVVREGSPTERLTAFAIGDAVRVPMLLVVLALSGIILAAALGAADKRRALPKHPYPHHVRACCLLILAVSAAPLFTLLTLGVGR